MILRRLGNKSRIAKDIIPHFPDHSIYIEPFFGAGGMFFNKPKVKYNIVNDLDSDVFNLFMVVMNQKEELKEAFYKMPIHSNLLEYWKKNLETDPIKKALRFLLMSNLTYNGQGSMIVFGASSSRITTDKIYFPDKLDKTFNNLADVQFMNKDCKKFLKSIMLDDRSNKTESDQSFIYCDPPYLNTTNNYSNSFNESDVIALFDVLQETKIKFAYSEFDNPFIINQAKERGLNIIEIGERKNLKNRRTEILITNYSNRQLTLF